MFDETKPYDLVVIGGGPAGIIGAATAATLGHTVALVDSHSDLGGAGANTGTVPSKTLRETHWLCRALALATSTVWIFRYGGRRRFRIFCATNET